MSKKYSITITRIVSYNDIKLTRTITAEVDDSKDLTPEMNDKLWQTLNHTDAFTDGKVREVVFDPSKP